MLHRSVSLLLVTLVFEARAHAQASLVSQVRSVEVQAQTNNGVPPQVSQSITAPNSGPFSASPSVQTSGSLGNASAWSSQSSTIAANRITSVADTDATANVIFDMAAGSSSSASSSIEVVFDLSFPVRYLVSGSLDLSYPFGGGPSVTLRSATSDVFVFLADPMGFGTPFNQSGLIAPGRYTLTAWADAAASKSVWWYFAHRSKFSFDFALASIVGDNYCSALPNSSGSTAVVGASGSDVVANADLTLHVSGAKPNAAGLFFYGPQQAPQPFGSGLLCVGAPRYRLHSPAQTNAAGALDHVVDFNAAPAGAGASAFAPGVTWNFQFWYRDSAASPTFNTSNGLSIAFQ